MRSRRSISPVIATVIIVAVAIAISIAVAGWLMGLWGTFGTTEQLTVMPDTSLTGSVLTLHIKNTGSKAAVITKVEVVGLGVGNVTSVTLPQGADTTIFVGLTTNATAGTQYLIKVYTASGNVYQGYVVASS
ncbi:MAG: DUF4352 domain-containing protein [Desulfurococcales archaeon]|nr:DUF4352 domain-containing protein [Desulfurococcales archaeon]